MSINFIAPTTCATFAKSEAFGRLLAGPVGSGKTTTAIMELLRRTIAQVPGRDGLRHTRFAVVRETYKQLKDTVLQDCNQWLSQIGQWKVSDSAFYLDFGDVKSQWFFLPLETAEDQARLLSMQLTGAWMSEAIEMDLGIVPPLSGRCGRFPNSEQFGTATWFGVIADTNMPAEMTPWHTFMTNPPKDWEIFIQPSGLDPPYLDDNGVWRGAENLNFLLQTPQTKALPLNHPVRLAQGRKYYERLMEMHGEDSPWIKRYVKAQYGDDPSGAAVFKETFKPHFHVVPETHLIPGYPVMVAQDFGRSPWSLICQHDHKGRLVVHDEVPAVNIGLEKHLDEHVRPLLMTDKYLGARICFVGDPAGIAKDSISEENSFDVIGRKGFAYLPAPTNVIDPRIRAVEALLGQQVDGGPRLAINRKCIYLIRSLAGGYRYSKNKEGVLRNEAKPQKDDGNLEVHGQRTSASHVADCLQYASLMVHGNLNVEIARRISRPYRKPRPKMPTGGWT